MTNRQELGSLWTQLSNCYQAINCTSSKAQLSRLNALAEMLRIEYRSLTSNYR